MFSLLLYGILANDRLPVAYAQDFDHNLEGLDFTNFAEWDLEAFWNF